MCRHIYDWNIVNCDVKQLIHSLSLTQRSFSHLNINSSYHLRMSWFPSSLIWEMIAYSVEISPLHACCTHILVLPFLKTFYFFLLFHGENRSFLWLYSVCGKLAFYTVTKGRLCNPISNRSHSHAYSVLWHVISYTFWIVGFVFTIDFSWVGLTI